MKCDAAALVPVPLGFDMWMHLGDGEFKLTDPVNSTGITGVERKRTHGGGCGVMQFEQLQSQRNCEVIGSAWKDILSQLPHAAAHARRRAEG